MAVTHLNTHNKDFSGIILSGKELEKFNSILTDEKIQKKHIKKLNKSLKNIRKIEL